MYHSSLDRGTRNRTQLWSFGDSYSTDELCPYELMCADAQRRRRDLNPRAAINDLLPFQGSPFSRLGTSPQAPKSTGYVRPVECIERRGWDSNPRALADKRFSRPPRYDHFDTSPYFNFFQLKIAVCISDFVILSKSPILVNRFFKIFSKFFRQRFLRLPDPPVW